MRGRLLVSILTLALLFSASPALAGSYVTTYKGREVVVHSSPIPVILHRAVPPQLGRHVTQREIATGTVPTPRKFSLFRSSAR